MIKVNGDHARKKKKKKKIVLTYDIKFLIEFKYILILTNET